MSMTGKYILLVLFVVFCAVMTYVIFKYGMRAKEVKPGQAMRPMCMNCSAAEFCNDIKRYERLADTVSTKKNGVVEASNTFRRMMGRRISKQKFCIVTKLRNLRSDTYCHAGFTMQCRPKLKAVKAVALTQASDGGQGKHVYDTGWPR